MHLYRSLSGVRVSKQPEGETKSVRIYRPGDAARRRRPAATARGHQCWTPMPRPRYARSDTACLQTESPMASCCNWLKSFPRSDCTSPRAFRSRCQSWVIKTAQSRYKIYCCWLVAERSVTTRRLVCEDPKSVCTLYATGRQCPNEEITSQVHKTQDRQVDISHGDHLR